MAGTGPVGRKTQASVPERGDVSYVPDLGGTETDYGEGLFHGTSEHREGFFLFCCLTGLSYIDVKTLCPAHLYKDNEGKLWIHKARVKITTHKESCTCNVPLLEPALVILEKYKNWNPENPQGPCFPIPSNQKMNEFLKEIATLCRVNKRLTVHVARHTFATTVTLANDVALQNVSKMLGHSSTRMTQHYARVLDNSIMKDMQDVARVFG